METTGRQVLVDLWGCDETKLRSLSVLDPALREVAGRANVGVIDCIWHKFPNGGITGILVLEESHISIHTWPEQRYVSVDFYACGKGDPSGVVEIMKRATGAKRVSIASIVRGLHRYVKDIEADQPSISVTGVHGD